MKWNLPNILTAARLLAAPLVAVMFLYFTRPYADFFALFLFLTAAITDWFDGYLARAWKQETKIGAMLDPIADKAMVVIALAVIVGYSAENWPPWFVLPAAEILFRAMIGDVLNGVEEDGLGLIAMYTGVLWSGLIGLGLLSVAAILTAVTGWDYFRKAMPYLKEAS